MIYTLVRKLGENVDAIFSFDSISSFDESWTATVTTQTVEKGFNISDNINIEPPSFDIQAVISSYSLFKKNKEIVWDGEQFATDSDDDDPYSHTKAREELLKIFTDRSIITVVESSINSDRDVLSERLTEITSGYYKEIDNCVITSISISHPDSSSGAFSVSLKLQKIFVAVVETNEVTKESMIPLLRPVLVDTKDSASKTKVKDENGDLVDVVAVDDTDLNDGSTKYVGMTDAEGARKTVKVLTPYRNELEAIQAAQRKSASSKQNWEARLESGAWWLYPTG